MAQQMKVFVSHSHQDNTFCKELVKALREAGADVWYDEHNLGPGVLRREIMKQLAERPVFLVVLSKATFASEWVRDECEWAYNIYKRKPERLLLPVVAGAYDVDDFDALLYIESLRRVEAPGHKQLPTDEAIARTLRLLVLTPAGAAPTPATPQPAESVDDLIAHGKALLALKKYAEAIPFLEGATQRAPRSFDVWFTLGVARAESNRWLLSLAAFDRAASLNPKDAMVWGNRGAALENLGRHEEALAACEHALALDPRLAMAWANMGAALGGLGRHEEALVAVDGALALDVHLAMAWSNKGAVLGGQRRWPEALAAFDRALALDDENVKAWAGKSIALGVLGRRREAEQALRHAKELGWQG